MAVKQCSKCGADFGCTSPVAGCWCEQYTIPVSTLAHLRENFDNCLCPQCLEAYQSTGENAQMPVNKE